jgi:hypothetical protein
MVAYGFLCGSEAVQDGSNVQVGRKVRRGETIFFTNFASRTSQENLRVHLSKEKHEEGVLNQIGTTGRPMKTLKARPTT